MKPFYTYPSVAEKLKPYPKNPLAKSVDCILDYDYLDTGWKIKRWFKYDQTKLEKWYDELLKHYSDWKWEYGKHRYMWEYDPMDRLKDSAQMQSDTAWIMLTWGNDISGPVPWLRTVTKPEYNCQMPRNISDRKIVPNPEDLGARKCLFGYGKELIENMSCGPHDIQVAIHTPGTRLPEHQDTPDKLRFHMPIITDSDAKFIIDGEEIYLPSDGWCYLVNTTFLHRTDNRGNKDRVHIYGAVWTHLVLDLDLESMETFL